MRLAFSRFHELCFIQHSDGQQAYTATLELPFEWCKEPQPSAACGVYPQMVQVSFRSIYRVNKCMIARLRTQQKGEIYETTCIHF